jgi:RecA/RadA recombinase
MAKKKKKKTAKKTAKKKAKKPPKKKAASKGAASSPAIRTHKDLVNNVADLAAEFTKDHRDANAVQGGSSLLDSLVDTWIPTGCPVFDSVLQGGFPGGRLTQIFGVESTGKSTYVYSAMINCTRMGGVSILIDPEESFDPDRYRRMGGDPDAVILLQKAYSGKKRETEEKVKNAKAKGLPAMTVQDVFKYLYDIIDSIAVKPQWKGRPIFVGLDSLDNISTDEAINGDPKGMTLKPRLIREGLRKITTPIAQSNAAFVIVSQTIENVGQSYGPKQTTAGGGGPKFIASIRIQTSRYYDKKVPDLYSRTSDGDSKQYTGQALVTATTVKNKLNRPRLTAVTAINNDSSQYWEGVDPDFSMLYCVFRDLIVVKSGQAQRFLRAPSVNPELDEVARVSGLVIGTEYGFYLKQWREYLNRYPTVRDYLRAFIQHKFKRPDMYVPETEEESPSDASADATENTDQAQPE